MADDYLIASCLLNGIVSGLVSRSILNAALVGPGDFHACVTYPQYAGADLSRPFVDTIAPLAAAAIPQPVDGHGARRAALKQECEAMMRQLLAESQRPWPRPVFPRAGVQLRCSKYRDRFAQQRPTAATDRWIASGPAQHRTYCCMALACYARHFLGAQRLLDYVGSMRWIPDDVRCQLNPGSRSLLKRGARALVRSERIGGT
ncbi:hypothetical protein ABIA00_000022 [Bradyrhizobium ottawaense]